MTTFASLPPTALAIQKDQTSTTTADFIQEGGGKNKEESGRGNKIASAVSIADVGMVHDSAHVQDPLVVDHLDSGAVLRRHSSVIRGTGQVDGLRLRPVIVDTLVGGRLICGRDDQDH